MSENLIYRLRYPAWSWTHQGDSQLDKEEAVKDMAEAADEIERLRRIVVHLRRPQERPHD